MKDICFETIPLFDGIDAEHAEGLFSCLNAHVCAYQKGDLIRLAQSGDALVGVVLSGVVHMMKEDAWGHQVLIAYYGVGEVFGESLAFHADETPYISFLSAQPSRVLFLSMKHLLHPCREQCPLHLTLAQNMFRIMSGKNVHLAERLETISKNTLRDKILTYLSLQSRRQHSKYITVPINRTEMASYLQSNRSAMTRELAAMKAEGLIDYDGNTFILKREGDFGYERDHCEP